MADLYCEQQLFEPLDSISSMVVIRESPIKDSPGCVVFPPINHENLQIGSFVYGVDRYLESPSESDSPSSPSRRSGSFSSFSLFPSDSDGQPPVTSWEFDRKSPSETEQKFPPSLGGVSLPSDSNGQSPLITCEFDRKSPRSSSKQDDKSPPCDSERKSPWKPLYREAYIQDWWQLLLIRIYSKSKNLLTWFSTSLRSLYPVLAIAIWWWIRVRTRRKRVNGETTNRLQAAIKERDERIVKLLDQIAQMNELLINHHKNIISRR